MYEVELKFRLTDPQSLRQRLAECGAIAAGTLAQSDRYFRHPARDFAVTDEALRLRSTGQANCVTYKGPVVDRHTKTRRELEVPLADGREAADRFTEILQALGFEPVRLVRKQRQAWDLQRQSRRFEIALDEVTGLGTYAEIETLADEQDRDAARNAVLEMAAELGLSTPERRSYLALLLAQDQEKH